MRPIVTQRAVSEFSKSPRNASSQRIKVCQIRCHRVEPNERSYASWRAIAATVSRTACAGQAPLVWSWSTTALCGHGRGIERARHLLEVEALATDARVVVEQQGGERDERIAREREDRAHDLGEHEAVEDREERADPEREQQVDHEQE